MTAESLYRQHDRIFASNRFVYPVLSRRSKGISLGINLNPDKVCNFDCIYCQVDRTTAAESRFVEMDRLLRELEEALTLVQSGALFQLERFRETPHSLRRLNDMAFSGDGEPTTYKNFDELMERCAEVKRRHRADHVKMVLITNASMFHRPHVRRGLEILDANQGEVWAKLDAGTADYFRLIDRTTIPFQRILDNILDAARQRPVVIQSLFMCVDGEPPPESELEAYVQRLVELRQAGGQVRLVQVYTVARTPAETYVEPWADQELDRLVARVQLATGWPAEAYYGVASPPPPEETTPIR
jgi:wyosine [tRNA(Phe)-imidazoG37] synthetase (radical SAM superfamily)